MECPIGADQTADMSSFSGRTEGAWAEPPRIRRESLRCVWTGDHAMCVSCLSHIPEEAVIAAWHRELERGGVRSGRPFRVAWKNGIWLAYGLEDGGVVGGVHCPSHRADCEEPALVADAPASEFALCA
jgi:hypothetical protein